MRVFLVLRSVAIVVMALAGIFAVTPASMAQNAYGSLVGTVSDSSGAVVPSATVTLTNPGTNENKVVQSDASGNYRILNLLPAQYRVEFEKTGFKRVVQSPITIQVDLTARLDVTLQVGQVTETVEVNTQPPLLQTESGTLGAEIEGQSVTQMPLNGRNTMDLIALAPGIVPEGSLMGSTSMNQATGGTGGTHTINAGWGNFQIGGAIAGEGTEYVDGAPLNSIYGNFPGYVPTQDAIQEFKVGTNAVGAEFGRFGGGVVEMTTKSGTNRFHGTAYEYLRNTVLNANIWNPTPAVPLVKQKWNQNQYGITVGGPVLRNKAFFFFAWEHFSSRTTQVASTNVPDAGMMADANPSVPGNLTTSAVLPASQSGCLSYSSTTGRTTIATSCLDPVAQLLKNYFAPPTSSNAVGSSTNYNVLAPIGDDNTEYNARGDINLGKQSLFLRYTHLGTYDTPLDAMFSHDGWKTANANSIYPTHQAVVGDTVTINPTTIADVRLSYMRQYFDDKPPNAGSNLSTLGLGSAWAAINAQQNIGELPGLSFSGKYNFYKFGAINITDERWINTYALSASLTKISGAHTLKFGGEVREMDNNTLPQFAPGALTITNSGYAKDEWANFLLGDISSFTASKALRTTSFSYYQGYYVADTWNATRKLTITPGLRWELPGAVAEKKDRGTVLLPNVSETVNGANALGILALLNSSQWTDRTTDPGRHDLFSPRLGIAYRLNDKTVVRAGYALIYLPVGLAVGVLPSSSPVDLAPTSATNPGGTSAATSGVKYTVSNPIGLGTANAVTLNQPSGRTNPNFLFNYANVSPALQSVSSPVPTGKVSYMQQWNFTVGLQFRGQQSIEAGYTGATGIHLPSEGSWGLDQLSQANAQLLAFGAITAAQAQALRPHPAYQNLLDSNPLNGTATYNGAQAKYEKRMGTGLVTSSFTLSKSIGDTDNPNNQLDAHYIGLTQNFNDIRQERSLLSFSIFARWVTSYIVDLPFGSGQHWANHLNPGLDRLIGGWSVNGITTLESGQPLTLTQTNNTLASNYGAGTIRPDYDPSASGCNGNKKISGSAQSRVNEWFNTACFVKAGTVEFGPTSPMLNYALGNEPRVDSKLFGAGIANWDFTIQKSTKITESTNVAFRFEVFNLFNRRQFSQPVLSVSSAAFGTITTQQNNPRQAQASLRFNF